MPGTFSPAILVRSSADEPKRLRRRGRQSRLLRQPVARGEAPPTAAVPTIFPSHGLFKVALEMEESPSPPTNLPPISISTTRASSFMLTSSQIPLILALFMNAARKVFFAAAALVAISGCGKSSTANAVWLPPQMSMLEARALVSPEGLKPRANDVLIAVPAEAGNAFIQECPALGLQVTKAYLRNPGVMAYLFRGEKGGRIPEVTLARLGQIASRFGLKFETKLQVKRLYGPDGKTPMVLKNKYRYPTHERISVQSIASQMRFSTREAAETASKYIDPKTYRVEIREERFGGWTVRATWLGRASAAHAERQEFEPLARKFGGYYDWTSTAGQFVVAIE